MLAPGICGDTIGEFSTILLLDWAAPPLSVCVMPTDLSSPGINIVVLDIQMDSVSLSTPTSARILTRTFGSFPPSPIDLRSLESGTSCHLTMTLTDGNTAPVHGLTDFAYQGESSLVFRFGGPPTAVASVAPRGACAVAAGAMGALDGSASTAPDSTPGTEDDIAAYDWYEDYGLPGQRSIGSGRTLSVLLPLGSHALTLVVADRAGATSTSTTTTAVLDTTPPTLDCPAAPAAECQGAGGAYV